MKPRLNEQRIVDRYAHITATRTRPRTTQGSVRRALLCGDSLRLWLPHGQFTGASGDWRDAAGKGIGDCPWLTGISHRRDAKGRLSAYSWGTSVYTTASNTGISGNAAFTLCAWMTLNDSAGFGAMGWGNSGVALQAAGFYFSGASPMLAFAGGNSAVSPTAMTVGRYTFVCAVKAAGAIAANTQFYYDGLALGSSTGSSSTPNITNGQFRVGQWADYSGDHCNFDCSQVMLFNRTLTAGEVYALHEWFR